MLKNPARVAFPELLDLAPYTTGGVLNLEPTSALSGGAGAGSECLYRLAAAVCHYGQHAFGHYVCYRRAPVPPRDTDDGAAREYVPTAGEYVPAPPARESSEGTGAGWLRISDARVERCGVEAVLAEGSGVFMLYYERVPPPPSPLPVSVYAGLGGGEDSTETIRPGRLGGLSGSWEAAEGSKARVVRSVSVGVASASSSTLSLRSVSSPPDTPRMLPSAGESDVEGPALSTSVLTAPDSAAEDETLEDSTASLPTPPPTPKGDAEPLLTEAPPVTAQKSRKAKKKKKGKGAPLEQDQEQVSVAA
jgi:ubiquitin carboxyl-terminal hydrolase 1